VQEKEGEGDSDSPEDEEGMEGIEQMAVDEDERPRSSSPKEMDADVTELEIDDEGKSSTDVVEETMTIDSSESEDDETSKQPDDTSRSAAAATAGSPNSVHASDDLTSNTDVLLNSSPEAGATSQSVVPATPSSPSKVSGILTEVVRTAMEDSASLAFDLQRTTNAWHAYLEHKPSSQPQPPQPATRPSDLESADLGADDEKATTTLARVLSKVDFGLMEVVGQFNRGFIVARLSKISGEGLGASDDLFIVDQHAADEKYNFETLQATTRLESQRLFTWVAGFVSVLRRAC
jgi:DNA mismatch repair protein PMS2